MTEKKSGEGQEIEQALSRIHQPKNSMISRLAIESEITAQQEKYPLLSGQTSRYIRQAITCHMNARYQTWNSRIGKANCWVWVISDQRVPA